MPNTAASVTGLFEILSDFSSVNKQAVVATVLLEDTNSNTTCNATTNMYIGDSSDGSQTRQVGFAGQYAFITGAAALCQDSNTLLFEIRGASINTITTLSPSDSDSPIDDTVRPAVIHSINAYHYSLHSFSILGTVTSINGEAGSDNRHFSIKTECWNRNVGISLSLILMPNLKCAALSQSPPILGSLLYTSLTRVGGKELQAPR
jgi:hypothetical protein